MDNKTIESYLNTPQKRIKAIMVIGNYLNIHYEDPATAEKRLHDLADKIGVNTIELIEWFLED